MEQVTAKFGGVGMASDFWFAYRGHKVLCDRLVRVRRFRSEAAALKAGRRANAADFH